MIVSLRCMSTIESTFTSFSFSLSLSLFHGSYCLLWLFMSTIIVIIILRRIMNERIYMEHFWLCWDVNKYNVVFVGLFENVQYLIRAFWKSALSAHEVRAAGEISLALFQNAHFYSARQSWNKNERKRCHSHRLSLFPSILRTVIILRIIKVNETAIILQ